MSLELYRNRDKKVILDDQDFITEGGEGRIYGKGDTVYKIYLDPQKMVPLKKIEELRSLDHQFILNPQEVLYGTSGNPVGFTMPWRKDTHPLCRLFTNDFRARVGITNTDIVALLGQMIKVINFIHGKRCFIVDGNEMNYLVDAKKIEIPYFIDVDSYQTPNFPATAIMDSIRDYHTNIFSELSDWFSFAVVATQLLVGIHPYKGTHPDFGKSEMKRRMQQNVSIFNKKVRVPAAARDFAIIPVVFREWLERVLEKGERLGPPDVAGQIGIVVSRKDIGELVKFIVELYREFPSHILGVSNGYVVSGTTLFDMGGHNYGPAPAGVEMVFTPSGQAIKSWVAKNQLHLENLNGQTYQLPVTARNKMVVNNTLYVIGESKIVEVVIEELGTKIIPCIGNQWDILPLASQIFDGIICQSDFGAQRLMVFYRTTAGKPACMLRKFDELSGYRITEAKYDNQVAILIGEKQGRFDSLMFKFSPDFTDYRFSKEQDVPYHQPNFVVLDNGTVVRITPDDEVQVFSNRYTSTDLSVAREQGISSDMRLCKKPGGVGFTIGSKLFTFRMGAT